MPPVASVARPRLWASGALFAIMLFGRHDAERPPVLAPPPLVVAIEGVPAPAVVIQLQPKSDLARLDVAMVLEPPETGDHMNIGVAPLAAWISHLLLKLL
jgi:hypothetical protein